MYCGLLLPEPLSKRYTLWPPGKGKDSKRETGANNARYGIALVERPYIIRAAYVKQLAAAK